MSSTDTEQKKEIVQKEITLNMGPQHPATHGVLRLVLELQGETVVGCDPRPGYLHRGIEKWMESRTYHQIIPRRLSASIPGPASPVEACHPRD